MVNKEENTGSEDAGEETLTVKGRYRYCLFPFLVIMELVFILLIFQGQTTVVKEWLDMSADSDPYGGGFERLLGVWGFFIILSLETVWFFFRDDSTFELEFLEDKVVYTGDLYGIRTRTVELGYGEIDKLTLERPNGEDGYFRRWSHELGMKNSSLPKFDPQLAPGFTIWTEGMTREGFFALCEAVNDKVLEEKIEKKTGSRGSGSKIFGKEPEEFREELEKLITEEKFKFRDT